LLFVPGIPITLWGPSDGPVIVNEIPARMEVVFDPDAGMIPDPDALASIPALSSNQFPLSLAAGRVVSAGELLLSA
jgi:hypothetical protein